MPDINTVVVTPTVSVVAVNSSVPGSYESLGRLGFGAYNVKEYGAVGDGSTDDTAAILAATTAASAAGAEVVFPPGTYVISTSLSYLAAVDVIAWRGVGEVILDGSTSTDQNLIILGGTLGSAVQLTASPAKGDVTFSATGHGLVQGDIAYLVSTDSFSPESAFFVKGEIVEVEGVSGAVVTTRTALYDGYTAATTTVAKMNAPRIEIENIQILRNSNHEGLELQYARDIYLRNVRVSGARYSSLNLWWCVGGVVENCGSDDAWYTGSGNSYGLVINSCQWLTVIGGTWYGGRHAIAHGGRTPVRGMSYLGVTAACDFVDSSVATFDTHDNTEYTTVRDCNIYGGMTGHWRNMRCEGNRFYQVSDESTVQAGFSSSSDYVVFRGNTCESQDLGYGVRLVYGQANVTVKLVDVSENTIIGASGVSISDGAFAGARINKLKLNGNYVAVTGASQSGVAVGGSGATLVVDDAEVIGGYYEAASNVAFNFRPHSDSQKVRIAGTHFKATGDVRPFALWNAKHQSLVGVRVEGNGFATNSFTMDAEQTVLRDSYFVNCGANNGFGAQLTNLSASVAQITGNVHVSCTGTIVGSSGVILVDYVDFGGRRIGRGTAAPTTGTWVQGDIVWNTTPSAAGFAGWVCVTGGTPGTWKTFGAISS